MKNIKNWVILFLLVLVILLLFIKLMNIKTEDWKTGCMFKKDKNYTREKINIKKKTWEEIQDEFFQKRGIIFNNFFDKGNFWQINIIGECNVECENSGVYKVYFKKDKRFVIEIGDRYSFWVFDKKQNIRAEVHFYWNDMLGGPDKEMSTFHQCDLKDVKLCRKFKSPKVDYGLYYSVYLSDDKNIEDIVKYIDSIKIEKIKIDSIDNAL